MESPVLLVLAAGLGSRFGGIKQMDPVGPGGEFVLDYSMFDAWRAGFKSAVLIIRPELEEPLREHFGTKLDGKLEVAYVCQDKNDLPGGYVCPETREKPWGTGHAIWSARKVITGPFGAVNADDFYGAESFQILSRFLQSADCNEKTYAMVAYRLANTLSEFGSVSRGICRADADGNLSEVVERTAISRDENGQVVFKDADGSFQKLTGEEPSSLNLWGFHPSLFAEMEKLFLEFLKVNSQERKTEFFIPSVVDTLIKRNICRTRVLNTPEHWFGMTYKEDREMVKSKIAELIQKGTYPEILWK